MRAKIFTILLALCPSLVHAGGVDTKPIQLELNDAVLFARLIEGEGGVDTIFPKSVLRVSSAALVAESSTTALIELNNSEIFVEVDKRELSKSDELFKKIETAQ